MTNQLHPYNPTLATHFLNLTLAAEAQSTWESNDPDHHELENPFAVPLECYDKLFATSEVSGATVKADVDGPIQEQYELGDEFRGRNDEFSCYFNNGFGRFLEALQNRVHVAAGASILS